MIHELRIYTAHPGKMPALQARFRDHTVGIFERCGIKNVAYWTNSIGGRSDELWYVLAFDDMAQRDQAWAAFMSDPEWREVRAASEEAGPLVHHIENRILAPTDYSPLPDLPCPCRRWPLLRCASVPAVEGKVGGLS